MNEEKQIMNKAKHIKMIALDLDRTTLREDGTIPMRTADALNRAGEQGIQTVIATGRVLDALPESLSMLKYVKYYICSNGAAVFRLNGRGSCPELLHEKCLEPEAVETMTDLVKDAGLMFESFTGGQAYIGKDYYEKVEKGLIMYRGRDYVLKTRRPVDDIFGFTIKHRDKIENLNVFFPNQEEKNRFQPLLAAIPDATLTSSVPSNYELGGKGVSKGAALRFLMDLEGISSEELMAAGDSPNDITMLELAGVSVAVDNAEESVKQVCSYIVSSNEDAGVGEAVEKFVLGE
ncbi:MAG: HAD family phosphatase [Eubacterium sp.]|nr:HAD family phosphatase [Eubacterium sp.]